MSDVQLDREWMALVERVVRPIACDRERKRRMRNELYDLLAQIHADEQPRHPTDDAARAATRARFGEPEPLRATLEASLPPRTWAQRIDAMLLPRARPDGPIDTLRMGVAFALAFAVPAFVLLEVVAWIRPLRAGAEIRLFFLVLTLSHGVMSVTTLTLGRWALGDERRPIWQGWPTASIARWAFASLAVGGTLFVAMTALYALAGEVSELLDPLRLAAIVGAGALPFAAVSQLVLAERESDAAWDDLTLADSR